VAFSVQFPGGQWINAPFFVASEIAEGEIVAEQIHDVLQNLKLRGETISPNFPKFDPRGRLMLQGVLGVDLLPLFTALQIVPCLSGVAMEVGNGIVPYGDVAHFLPFEKIQAVGTLPMKPKPSRLDVPAPPVDVEGAGAGRPLFDADPVPPVSPLDSPFEPWPADPTPSSALRASVNFV
jgi:hypothetical protein